MSIYTYMYNGNFQQNPLCAASCVTKVLCISPRFSPTMFLKKNLNAPLLRFKFSALTSTPIYCSWLYAQKKLFSKLFMRRARESLFYTCSCETQYRFDECICAAPVTAQNIIFVPRVVPSVLQYIRCTSFFGIMHHQALSFCSLGIPCPFFSQISRPLLLCAP